MLLQAGDVFCVEGSMSVVSSFIRLAEQFWSTDNKADYGHAGIILNDQGKTFEVLWTAKKSDLSKYLGQKIIIARPTVLYGTEIAISSRVVEMTLANIIQATQGLPYPVHRLFLHLVPPLAKYVSLGKLKVCSELVAEYLKQVGARPFIASGINPDTLADMFIEWKNFDVLYEGVFKGVEY